MSLHRGPIGGWRRWHILTKEGLQFRVEGELLHSRCGTALIYGCDCDGTEHLLFGISPKLIQRITAEDRD